VRTKPIDKMKKFSIIAIGLSILLGCSNPNGNVYVNSPGNPQTAHDVTVNPTNLGANLDLQALGELVKTSKNAQDIEQKLNAPGSINNLDLAGTGTVNYITVTEYGDQNTKGFSFTVDLGAQGKQEVATVTVDKSGSQANINISGNQAVYGANASYNASYPLTDFLICSYLFSYHPYYMSPWGYGRYPSYYHSYAYTPYRTYHSRMNTSYGSSSRIKRTTTTTTTSRSSVKSPNSTASSNTVNARSRSLSNPTVSQKSFSARPANSATPKATGFSNKSSSSPAPSRSTASSSPSRSFGSSSKSSSSSSSRSSSSGSRRR
jgi:hypothetical protein